MPTSPLFTTIVHTYHRPAMLKIAVEALRKQTYSNLEIILINNGGIPEVVDYLQRVISEDDRIKLINFEENQFSWDDPIKMVDVCWNAALRAATGEYVWIQEDDDFLAKDYVEKMVALFQGNPNVTTAAGVPISVDVDGNVNEYQNPNVNIRPKYTPGQEVALDQLLGNGEMYSAPGTMFTIKRDVLIQAGGYHRAIESSQLYGIVPFGVTGFDPTALLYWRHHTGQLNKELSNRGWIGTDESLSLLNDWDLERRWSLFGESVAGQFVRSYKQFVYDHAATWFIVHLYGLRPWPAFKLMRKLSFRWYFWARVLKHGLERKYYLNLVSPALKPPLKRLFRTWPAVAKLTPTLRRLSEKADRWE